MLDRVVALWTERVALPFDDLIDLEALESRIRADLLEWETLGFRLQNPMSYAGPPGNSIELLLKREFAPAPDAAEVGHGRLRGLPALYAAGKANMKTPPKEWTESGASDGQRGAGLPPGAVGPWAKEAAGGDMLAQAEFNRANTTAIAATQDCIDLLEKDLKPRSTGSWAIGAAFFPRSCTPRRWSPIRCTRSWPRARRS